MRTFRKHWANNRQTVEYSEDGYDLVVGGGYIHDDVRVSPNKRLGIVSKGGKFGIILMQEEFNRVVGKIVDTELFVCGCRYDGMEFLSNARKNCCDFLIYKNGKCGIGRVLFSSESGFLQTGYAELLPCEATAQKTNNEANIYLFSDDEGGVRYYNRNTGDLSPLSSAIRSSELFIICHSEESGIIIVHAETNRIIFKRRADICKPVALYEEGEVYIVNDYDECLLVFCNDEKRKAYVIPGIRDMRAEIIFDKYHHYLSRLSCKKGTEWETFVATDDYFTQKDVETIARPCEYGKIEYNEGDDDTWQL